MQPAIDHSATHIDYHRISLYSTSGSLEVSGDPSARAAVVCPLPRSVIRRVQILQLQFMPPMPWMHENKAPSWIACVKSAVGFKCSHGADQVVMNTDVCLRVH
eukprot:6323408-Amphidinium_carterae.1